MRALVLFRSYSGNTKQVAEAVAASLRGAGHETEVRDLRTRLPDIGALDMVVVGAPTRMGGPTRRAYRVLRRLRRSGFTGKTVAVFDTFGPVATDPAELEKTKNWLYPGAAGKLQTAAQRLGLKVHPELLRCQVAGSRGPLLAGALELAAAWARRLAAAKT